MNSEMLEKLGPFREEALARDIPSDDVERWIGFARPCATLSAVENGPVVAQFGGPLMLPVDAPAPRFPFVASIDCAALPEGATDLLLPPDGQLLLFAFPDNEHNVSMGEVLYVPAGTIVEERAKDSHFFAEIPEYWEICRAFPQGPLRMTANVSLPYHCWTEILDEPWHAPLPGHPYSEQLRDVWLDKEKDITARGPLRVGGYASDERNELDPVAEAASLAVQQAGERAGTGTAHAAEDWVLLAEWHPGISGREGATVHWVIRRDDLAARRFGQVRVTVFWNP
ncbi:DUF1963 domain-containing protein [Streptomyces sp. NPDC058405]|uniref:DUF1963 domain-containing protein n=1 Tax=Streptomyces sp. NPDC058405 TaxID=3346482 RepID=UPI0036627ACD